MVFLIVMFFGAAVSGFVADSKGRSAFGWGLIGFLLPVFALVAIVWPRRTKSMQLESATPTVTTSQPSGRAPYIQVRIR